MSADCVFCRIIAGEIPAVLVYEDERTIALMDIGPVVKGHTLVIPKAHHNPLVNTPVAVLQDLIAVVQRIAAAQIAGLNADGVNVTQANGKAAGQIVPHIHFHVIPRFDVDGQHGNWVPKKYDSPDEMKSYAARIKAALRP